MMEPDPEPIGRLVAEALTGEADVLAAYVFGSTVEGRSHRESDVDVGVLLSRERLPGAAARFNARLLILSRLEARLRRSVDLVVLNDAPPGLGRHVVFRGRRVFVRDAEADHAFVRDVQLRAADLEPFLRRLRRLKLDALARP